MVGASAAARPFGTPLPYFGLLVALTLLAAATTPRISIVGRPLASLAATVATGLTLYSAIGLRALCPWCVASNALLIALAFVWSGTMPSVAPSLGRWIPFPLLALAGAGWYGSRPSDAPPFDRAVLARVVPERLTSGPSLGRGRRTVVLFGHLSCPACGAALRELLPGARAGRYRLVLRDFAGEIGSATGRRGTRSEVAESRELAGALRISHSPTMFGVAGREVRPLWPARAARVWAESR